MEEHIDKTYSVLIDDGIRSDWTAMFKYGGSQQKVADKVFKDWPTAKEVRFYYGGRYTGKLISRT